MVIWSRRAKQVQACGAKSTHTLQFGGDLLFAICSRHNKRLTRAFPKAGWT